MSARLWFAFFLYVGLVPAALAESRLIAALDTNKDGAIDLNEAQAGANAAFDRLLKASPSELLSPQAEERLRRKFLAAVDRWFKVADVDGDGKLDKAELDGPAGQKLEKLLSK